jgi:hypothetical protein
MVPEYSPDPERFLNQRHRPCFTGTAGWLTKYIAPGWNGASSTVTDVALGG